MCCPMVRRHYSWSGGMRICSMLGKMIIAEELDFQGELKCDAHYEVNFYFPLNLVKKTVRFWKSTLNS